MDLKCFIAILIGKLVFFINKLFGRSGTALPGLVAQTIDKNILFKLSSALEGKTIIITGTNGKTTISHLLTHILTQSGNKVLHNTAGSNLERGIISLYLNNFSFISKKRYDLKVLEIDEAALNSLANKLKPDVIIFSSLFRDQLDRYGEVNTVRDKWQRTINQLPDNVTLILNADDPGIASLGVKTNKKTIHFGICKKPAQNSEPFSPLDFNRCPLCNHPLNFKYHTLSHFGDYSCRHCSFKRPVPQVCFELTGNKTIINADKKRSVLNTNLQGIYNLYNITAVLTIALYLKKDLKQAIENIRNFKPAFGRQEKLQFKNKILTILLVKNPTGFSEVIRTYLTQGKKKDVVILLNDKIADGTDVSWIWDVNFSPFTKSVNKIILGGTRRYDMALRLIYEGIDRNSLVFIEKADEILNQIDAFDSKDLYIFTTYTALLTLEKLFVKNNLKKKWED